MSNKGRFRAPEKSVEWVSTKYDGFKLVKTGEYRMQKGSARAQCLDLARDGLSIGTWTKKCADIGHHPIFAVNCLQKLRTTAAPGWSFSDKNADGLTYDEVLKSRSEKSAKEKKVKKAVKEAKPKPKRVRVRKKKEVETTAE